MIRRWFAVTAAGLGLVPLAVLADSGPPPSPTPSLQSILMTPPDAYSASASGQLQGKFTLAQYASTWGTDATKALNELEIDRFVDGYQIARADPSSGRVMVEVVAAFAGQKGAVRFMAANLAETRNGSSFKHSNPLAGVGPNWYGVHLAQASPALAADAFAFVKGNDLFGVTVSSAHDDVALFQYAQVQAEKQYLVAPSETIPSTEWPENRAAQPTDQGFSLDSGPLVFAGVAVIALLAAAGVFVWMRQNELRPEKTKVPKMAKMAETGGKLSADGQYWWTGTYWISSSEMAPPWAQRSGDGAYWWDGHAWRAVPRPPVSAGR